MTTDEHNPPYLMEHEELSQFLTRAHMVMYDYAHKLKAGELSDEERRRYEEWFAQLPSRAKDLLMF